MRQKKPQKGKYLFETEDLNEANRPQGQEDHEQQEKESLIQTNVPKLWKKQTP